MSRYPILVEHYRGEQATTIVCERCHAERIIDCDEISSEDVYECPADTDRRRRASIEPRCRGSACMKYELANACRGCGKLGFWKEILGYCCSRRCMLQAEYAETLRHTNG